MSLLKPGDWPTFIEYEQTVTAHFTSRRIVALCSYALRQRNDELMRELLHAYHLALQGSDADRQWVTTP